MAEVKLFPPKPAGQEAEQRFLIAVDEDSEILRMAVTTALHIILVGKIHFASFRLIGTAIL